MTKQIPEDIPVFDLSLIDEGLSEKAKAIMAMLDERHFIIMNYKGKYEKFIMTMIYNMLEGYEHEEFRNHTVMYKFRDDPKEEVKWLPFKHFIINAILWNPMMMLDPENINESMIVHSSEMVKMTPIYIKQYMDRFYTTKYDRFIPAMPNINITRINHELNYVIGVTNHLLTRISAYFSDFFGISSSIETFMDLAQRIPEINELFHFRLDDDLQPSEMEKILDQKQKELVKYIEEDVIWNSMKPLMIPGAGLNMKQVKDTLITIGPRPNQDGKTIHEAVNKNFLIEGLDNPVDYYKVAIAGRKAAIINNEFMGKTGHLLILIAICTASVKLSRTTMDCGSPNQVPIDIKSEEYLVRLEGRRYRLPGTREFKTVSREDKHLVGETLYVRSPITCCCHDGVCRECYGDLYYTNIDNYSAGVFSATYVMNPVVQGILSAKHHQKTDTSKIEFSEDFYLFFGISSTDIIIDPIDGVNIMDYCLVIPRESIMSSGDEDDNELDSLNYTGKKKRRKKKSTSVDTGENFSNIVDGDEDDGGMELNLQYYVKSFMVAKNLNAKNAEPTYETFSDIEEKELYMHTDFIRRMVAAHNEELGDYLYIPLEDIPQEEFIFVVDVYNNELTRPMKSIQKVLNSKNHEGCNTYEDMVNKMIELLIASKIDATSVHSEMIIRELVRKKNNIIKRPDFHRVIMSQDYQLLSVNTALKENPAICTSLSTPYLKDQLVSLTETFSKTDTSVFDDLFRHDLM